MRPKSKERVLTRNVKALEAFAVQDLRVPLLDETGKTLDLVSKEEQRVLNNGGLHGFLGGLCDSLLPRCQSPAFVLDRGLPGESSV
jgi:hypothetical protein